MPSCIVRSNCFVLSGQGKDPANTSGSGSNDDASNVEGTSSLVGNAVGNVEKVGEVEGSVTTRTCFNPELPNYLTYPPTT